MASANNKNKRTDKKTSAKASGRKSTTAKKRQPASSKSKTVSAETQKRNFEISAICIIAFCLYVTVCIYSGGKGVGFIGKWIYNIFTGIIGSLSYILPLITVGLIVYSLRNMDGGSNRSKYVLSYASVIDAAALMQLMFVPSKKASEWFTYGMSGKPSGGFIGGITAKALSVFGITGAYILLICLLIVFVILIFNISVSDVLISIRNIFADIKRTASEYESEEKQFKRSRGTVTEPDISKISREKDTPDVLPESAAEDEPIFVDPEIKIYDDVTSGPEDMEPSDEEKAAKKISDDEKENIDREIKEEIENGGDAGEELIEYTYPSIDLLSRPQSNSNGSNVEELRHNAKQLIETLRSFKVEASVVEISQGPTITRYEIEPAEGVRVSQVTGLSKDIGLKFKADKGVMVAPVPGKSTIGIEIENKNPSVVSLREVIESEEFKNHKSKLAVALGKDVSGKPIIMDLAKMPHLLIAGATGAGKSVCINTIIISLMYKADPNEVKLVMIDPKQVELGVYNGIPHLLIPVVKDAKKATGALSWAVQEMTERYSTFEQNNVRNIKGYNELMEKNGTPQNKMASIVIVIDEFADLMMVAPADVENYVCRIAQLARAAGMHLVIATQRPVVKFITGNIKANVPSRISFMVASVRDSQTILDMGGAEKLIGKGDMLYMPVGETSPNRMQGAFVSDADVKAVVEAVSSKSVPVYDPNVIEQIEKDEGEYSPDGEDPGDCDELLSDAIDMAVTSGQISTSLLQRRFRIGYNRAGSIIDQMEARGIISGLDGNKPRQVLITREQYNEMLMK